MQRTRWYEPRIDPSMQDVYAEAAAYGRSMPDRRELVTDDNDPEWDNQSNLVGSLVEGEEIGTADALHMPVIDFDAIPMWLVPSSTPGNFHLYIDKPITWAQYVPILEALANAGLVEHDYVGASIKQGSTFVRPEGVKRPDPRPSEQLRAELQAEHRPNGESAIVRSQAGHEPRRRHDEHAAYEAAIRAQAQKQSDHTQALVGKNLISGVCCGDAGDCGHECGIAGRTVGRD